MNHLSFSSYIISSRIVLMMGLLIFSPGGLTESYSYDGANRVTRVTYPDGSFIQYAYDVRGNVTMVNRAPPIFPDINIAPESIDFGVISTGQIVQISLTVENLGPAPLSINSVAADDVLEAPFAVAIDDCTGELLNTDESCELAIEFAPSTEDNFADTFSIESNDPDEDPVIVDVSGQGLASGGTGDSDGDGVDDNQDQCPETSPDATVDPQGCAPSQLDTDGDGVADDQDQCPDTPQGETADATGCSDSQQGGGPPLSPKAVKQLEKAQQHTDKALQQLADGKSEKALGSLGKAAKELLKAEKEGADTEATINQLVDLARQTAEVALAAAQSFALTNPAAQNEVDKAEKEMAKAEEELGKENPDKAIKAYKKAVSAANRALKNSRTL
jgi:YD repeat-containing protein